MPEEDGQQSGGENHGDAKKLAHGKISEKVSNLWVRLLEKFYNKSNYPIE
jgi:hypothetical protein